MVINKEEKNRPYDIGNKENNEQVPVSHPIFQIVCHLSFLSLTSPENEKPAVNPTSDLLKGLNTTKPFVK
jgi:hypothetical protein